MLLRVLVKMELYCVNTTYLFDINSINLFITHCELVGTAQHNVFRGAMFVMSEELNVNIITFLTTTSSPTCISSTTVVLRRVNYP